MTVSGVSSTRSDTSGLASDSNTIAGNFDTFLSLLTTQLQNQNPLDPLDTNQFTSQLVQFSSVEQELKTNDYLASLVQSTQNASANAAVSYIGKTVTSSGVDSDLKDGQASWSFNLPQAANVTVTIKDSSGNQVYSETIAYTWGGVGDQKNPTTVDALNMWTPTNQTNNPTFSKTSNNYINSSRWVYDGSYIKLRSISLTYHLPQALISRWRMSNLEIYVSGQNLFCITKFPGYDPEVQNTVSTFTAGLENGLIPVPRSYTFGLRTSF